MNSIRILFFVLFAAPLYSQVEITNKNFNYFDLLSIENNHFQSQAFISATADEIGYNGEWFKTGKNYFSMNFSISFKHLLPNIGRIWTPLTMEWIPYFPKDGIMSGIKGKWYFNHRKFAYVGMKISGGYFWMYDKDVFGYIDWRGNSRNIFHLNGIQSRRLGFDFSAGRKFVNKFISEISLETGFRFDRARWEYACITGCGQNNDQINNNVETLAMLHLEVILGFDIFSK